MDGAEHRRQTLVAVRRANLRVLHSMGLIRDVIADGERLASHAGLAETGRHQARAGREVLTRLEAQRNRLELRLGRWLAKSAGVENAGRPGGAGRLVEA